MKDLRFLLLRVLLMIRSDMSYFMTCSLISLKCTNSTSRNNLKHNNYINNKKHKYKTETKTLREMNDE